MLIPHLSIMLTILQKKVVFKKALGEMDDNTDKAILKELKKTEGGRKMRGKIKEAEVVKNKKTGTKITRISAKDIKKKRR